MIMRKMIKIRRAIKNDKNTIAAHLHGSLLPLGVVTSSLRSRNGTLATKRLPELRMRTLGVVLLLFNDDHIGLGAAFIAQTSGQIQALALFHATGAAAVPLIDCVLKIEHEHVTRVERLQLALDLLDTHVAAACT